MKTIYAISLSTIMTILVLSGTQAALAAPGHSIIFLPASKVIVPGGTITGITLVAVPQVPAIAGTGVAHVLDVAPLGVGFSVSNAACVSQVTGGALGIGAGDIQTVLDDGGTVGLQLVAASLPGGTGIAQGFGTSLGPGAPVISFPAVVAGSTPTFYLSGILGFPALSGAPAWYQVFGPSVGSTAGPANAVIGTGNIFSVCGCDDNNGNGLCGTGDTDGSVSESYTVAKPVGGILIPVSTTALLLAGISANALWVLTGLATAAGAGFALLKFQVNRRD